MIRLLRIGLLAEAMHSSVLSTAYPRFAEELGVSLSFSILNTAPYALADTLRRARTGYTGLTVTMPYKRAVLSFCDALDPSAEAAGAANTLLIRAGRVTGFNTDGWGLLHYLRMEGVALAQKRVTLLGAGGAAGAIACQLARQSPARVSILNRDPARAQHLAARFGPPFSHAALTPDALERLAPATDLLINASALGQCGHPDFSSVGFLARLPAGAAVVDLNYANPDALLLPAAAARGLAVFSGRGMSICQGILAMRIWCGAAPSDAAARQLIGQTDPARRAAGRTGFFGS